MTYDVTGAVHGPVLVHPSPCAGSAFVYASATDGTTVWYEDVNVGYATEIGAVSVTSEDTVLVLSSDPVAAYNGLRELDWTGRAVFATSRSDPFAGSVHHDAVRLGELVYALFYGIEPIGPITYLEDGFYVFDRAGAVVAEWRLFDHWTPAGTGCDPDDDFCD